MKYRLWDWKTLGETFGYYLFWKFEIANVAEFVYAFLVKYYVWQILERTEGVGIFLEAHTPLNHEHIECIKNAKEDIVLGPYFKPNFIICNNRAAAKLANKTIHDDMERRYTVNRKHMFDFLCTNRPNILGQKFMVCTMIPTWQNKGFRVTDTGLLTGKEEDTPLTNFIPAFYPAMATTTTTIAEPEEQELNTIDDEIFTSRKSNSISCILPATTERVIVMGNDCIGITDISSFSLPNDAIIHINSCEYLKYTVNKPELTNIVYYSNFDLLPNTVTQNKQLLSKATQLYPGTSFDGFVWQKRVTSKVSSNVALACSYKEAHKKLPVYLYGYNVADDISTGDDSELEEVLLNEYGVTVCVPSYEVLYLVLTSDKRKLRWITAEATWCKKMIGTHHTWRFVYATPKPSASNIPHAWAVQGKEDTDQSLESFLAALKNAARMRFKYIFICKDTAEPDPLVIWSILLSGTHKCIGAREFAYDLNLFYFNLFKGACLDRETFDKMLPLISTEDNCTVDIALAKALKSANVALSRMEY